MLRYPFFVYNIRTQKKQIKFIEFNLLGGCGGRI